MALPSSPAAAPRRARRGLHASNPLRRLLFGRPVPTEQQEHSRLPKITALPVFSSDAISSVAYATQEILLALSVAGAAALGFTLHISLAIVALLVIVAISYTQTVFAYPSGGGSYIVAKDNLSVGWGLVAAAALLIDYVLTVATSIASGIQNMVPAVATVAPHIHGHEVSLCVAAVLILLFANLRGLKESGAVFAFPTYLFVFSCYALIFFGLAGPTLFHWRLHSPPPPPAAALPNLGMALILAAFARGCSAMTGVEAISNGVPAFQKPQSKNAAITLGWMAFILGTLFIGISALAVRLNIHYTEGSPAVIDQLNGIVFGQGSWFYYVLQAATVLVLVLAANTSFADFPRLSSILARDGFMPRQFANLGDRLTFTNGIVALAAIAILIIIAFGGNTDRLVPLYAIGVFIAFTLSQSGMVVHWWRERGRRWLLKSVVNGVGALATFVVFLTIAYEKIVLDIVTNRGREFGWIVFVLIGLMMWMFARIHRHYEQLRAALSLAGVDPAARPCANTVLIMVPRMHRGVLPALDYGRILAADVRAVHIEVNPEETPALKAAWDKWGGNLPLVILPSPYRSVIGPLLAYLDEVERERPDTMITVVVPEAVSGKWWHSLLHANYGAWMKLYLLNRRNIIVANVRYFIDRNPAPTPAGLPSAPQADAARTADGAPHAAT